ncbi:transcriptional regulator NrdR [Lichenicoccus roseus]|uniref:Transcriptional repressor NrdR n=1 Tax=Lichenicoccus roseus TaxID=2683649 RepID=A0A5R9JBR9_9PROT|nr:transcriptional regulator NrdR [Lichenicoccus roseus]TLU72836.1 transcriptional repressor NrdR [Lichenicoccus roseus]
MRCPFCGHEDTQVKDSRPNEDGAAIRRRRFCASCGQRFTTIERVQLRELVVTKVDGRRVPFERDKLARSIRIAMRKRPIDEDRIERIVNGLVRQLEASGEVEIASKQLGELVMDTLREVDAVAYVRFASVYRDFREARDFEAILGSLPSLPGVPIPGTTAGDGPASSPAAKPAGTKEGGVREAGPVAAKAR